MDRLDIEGIISAVQSAVDAWDMLKREAVGPLPGPVPRGLFNHVTSCLFRYELAWHTYLALVRDGLVGATVFARVHGCILSSEEFKSFASLVYGEENKDIMVQLAVERGLVWEVSGDPARDAETYRGAVSSHGCTTMTEYYAGRGVRLAECYSVFPLGKDGRYSLPTPWQIKVKDTAICSNL